MGVRFRDSRQISNNPKYWTRTKRNITKIFSSVSCINGSFLEKSSDKHYSTSQHQCGLDLSVTRQFFEKLSRKEKVLKEVESVVQQHLLPSLNHCPAGVEALRVYLILPELLRVLLKQQLGTNLAVSLAEAILKLCPDLLKVLEGYWARMGYSFFRTVVKNFHSVSTKLFELIRDERRDYSQQLKKTVEVLQKLYAVNSQTHHGLSDSHFHVKEINNFFKLIQESDLRQESFWDDSLESERLWESANLYIKIVMSVTKFPCIFDMEAKKDAFLRENSIRSSSIMLQTNGNALHVGRQTLLKDAFEYLRRNIHDFSRPLKVTFMEENGIDDGGISQEFFSLFSKALRSEDSKLLEIFEESELVWFMSDEYKVDDYRDIGTIFGMAFYNDHLVNIPFPSALFKRLLGEKPTLRDLEELSPCQARHVFNFSIIITNYNTNYYTKC
ncbi:probable E3 ubiquitin-protein ligase HERC3 [Clupea harengus]|uniref:HECT-type E3 ubiquitin transferase n=1 Tax=Clupea harengus TaxID=7950 RepID=A0A6P8FFE5_CLUHA|nr:probable E3 ubiquitin-protein ligase HERC3 [Clupea harengus]